MNHGEPNRRGVREAAGIGAAVALGTGLFIVGHNVYTAVADFKTMIKDLFTSSDDGEARADSVITPSSQAPSAPQKATAPPSHQPRPRPTPQKLPPPPKPWGVAQLPHPTPGQKFFSELALHQGADGMLSSAFVKGKSLIDEALAMPWNYPMLGPGTLRLNTPGTDPAPHPDMPFTERFPGEDTTQREGGGNTSDASENAHVDPQDARTFESTMRTMIRSEDAPFPVQLGTMERDQALLFIGQLGNEDFGRNLLRQTTLTCGELATALQTFAFEFDNRAEPNNSLLRAAGFERQDGYGNFAWVNVPPYLRCNY